MRRENEYEAFAFDQRGEARDAKRHQKKAKGRPEAQVHLWLAGAGNRSADVKRQANNETEPERGEPETRAGIKIPHQHYAIPDEVAPEYEPAIREPREVTNQHSRKLAEAPRSAPCRAR